MNGDTHCRLPYREIGETIAWHGIPSIALRFLSNVEIIDGGCWVWKSALNPWGYGVCTKSVYGSARAHRAAYHIFKGDIPEGDHVLHTCDVRHCVNPSHLWLGSHTDNMRDRQEKGRWEPPRLRGVENPMSKLSDKDVVEIRKRCAAGEAQQRIADEYQVGQMTISRIVRQETWAHV